MVSPLICSINYLNLVQPTRASCESDSISKSSSLKINTDDDLKSFLNAHINQMALNAAIPIDQVIPIFQQGLAAHSVHLIWCGKLQTAESYFSQVYALKEKNPSLNVIIWADFSKKEFCHCLKQNSGRREVHRGFFVDLNKVRSLVVGSGAFDKADAELLDRMLEALRIEQHNYVAASDLLRLILLYLIGGIYTDFDDAAGLVQHHDTLMQWVSHLTTSKIENRRFLAFDENEVVVKKTTQDRFLLKDIRSDYSVFDNPQKMMDRDFSAPYKTLSNNIIMGTKKHPYFSDALKHIARQWQARNDHERLVNTEKALEKTGPITERERILAVTEIAGMAAQRDQLEAYKCELLGIPIPCRSARTWLNKQN